MIVDLRLKRPNSVMAYNTVEIQFACTVQVHIGVQIYWSETIQPSGMWTKGVKQELWLVELLVYT